MRSPRIGEYWRASQPDEPDQKGREWLFLFVYQTKLKGRLLRLGLKCDWKTLEPMPLDDGDPFTVWFDATGNGIYAETFRYRLIGVKTPCATDSAKVRKKP